MKRYAFVDKNRCVACGVCVKECPKSAITVYKGCFARAAEDACVSCGKCAKACPVGCIELKNREVPA